MQQAYVNAYTHLRQFNGSARFSTWLTRIAINEALARVRQRSRHESFDDELANAEPCLSTNPVENPERQAFSAELRGLLECAIDTLPDGKFSSLARLQLCDLTEQDVVDLEPYCIRLDGGSG